jgi:hypothetical protein
MTAVTVAGAGITPGITQVLALQLALNPLSIGYSTSSAPLWMMIDDA